MLWCALNFTGFLWKCTESTDFLKFEKSKQSEWQRYKYWCSRCVFITAGNHSNEMRWNLSSSIMSKSNWNSQIEIGCERKTQSIQFELIDFLAALKMSAAVWVVENLETNVYSWHTFNCSQNKLTVIAIIVDLFRLERVFVCVPCASVGIRAQNCF